MHTEGKPKVSVLVWTFNNIKFIDDCIAGTLDQETTFSFEIPTRGTHSLIVQKVD